MKIEEKKQVTEELQRELREAGTIYLTDFTGLDVKSMTELRSRLREQGIRYRVVKNTLMLRALEGLGLPDLASHLEGPTGLVLGDEDPVVPAKVVREFAREHEDRPVVKIGVVERRTVDSAAVAELAQLPPKDELLGAIAGGLTSSVGGIAGVLGGLIRDIAYMVEEAARKREEA
jgi:large subunit ribosomal protein L10